MLLCISHKTPLSSQLRGNRTTVLRGVVGSTPSSEKEVSVHAHFDRATMEQSFNNALLVK